MTDRIAILAALTLKGEMYATPTPTPYEDSDRLLPETEREVTQLCRYIRNQEPMLCEHQAMTGFFNCDSTVVAMPFVARATGTSGSCTAPNTAKARAIFPPLNGSTPPPITKRY